MTDIIIPLNNKSPFNNAELRYCLRGIEKYASGVRQVFIVGDCPNFLKNVVHIPFREKSNKEFNIMSKIVEACKHEDVSDDFLFFNDDHFLLRPIDASAYPNYFDGNLIDWDNGKRMYDPYKESVHNTMNVLHRAELPSRHFDIHCPIIYNKDKFMLTMMHYDWDVRSGYVIKSLYANTNKVAATPMKDLKISAGRHIYQIAELIKDRHVFSIGDAGLNDDMRKLLDEIYPDKSKYEK